MKKNSINITEWMKQHTEYISETLSSTNDTQLLKDVLGYHKQKIQELQHERLVHLIIMCITGLIWIFSCILYVILNNLVISLLLIAVSLILICYILHYCRLENTVQYWYKQLDLLYFKSKQ